MLPIYSRKLCQVLIIIRAPHVSDESFHELTIDFDTYMNFTALFSFISPDSSPMSQRNFPPSFWNSAYQPPPSTISSSHHDLQFTPDPYIATSIHGLSGLHHQDPWHYTISSQTHGYPHRSMHDFAYSTMATPSRYNPHYGSLLMQPSVSAGRLGGCDMTKPSESWSSRYHPDHRLASEFSSRAHLDSGISGNYFSNISS